jgi:two-component system, NtrC family, response regulator AtoC
LSNQDQWGPTLVEGEAIADVGPGTLSLIVISDGPVLTLPLDGKQKITIGRTEANDVQLSDPSVSREHAIIYVSDRIEIEDLGSGNGTKVGGEKITPHARVEVEPRELVEIGAAMLLVQENADQTAFAHRLFTHGWFEAALEEQCARRGGSFSVLRLRVSGSASRDTIRRALTADLGPTDLVAAYAPGEYELLLHGATERVLAERIAADIRARLEGVVHGAAVFPVDGKTPDALLEAASAAMRKKAASPKKRPHIVEDPAMRDLYVVADRLARGKISVLLLGETGVGKEVFAEAIHERSPRAQQPFVRLNCAAFSETLLESELFGHEAGAFTGAVKEKPGLLEIADGGTVFLDELGEMSAATQSKLLRVIEQRQVLRVGGLTPRTIDVRFVSATNSDLEREVQRGNFREDLFYRLDGVTLHIPPLRERKSEILELARAFLEENARELGRTSPRLSDRARDLLLGYSWPGNIRELKNVMERASLLAIDDEILPEHLPVEKLSTDWRAVPQQPEESAGPGQRLTETDLERMMEDEERRKIMDALDKCGGNQTRAADLLGMSRRTLSKRLNKYGVPRPRKVD